MRRQRLHMCCVMVVEDNADLRLLYKQAVDLEGHCSLVAANGQEALFILRNEMKQPDVILLDLMMPIMDGWEFLREKEKDPNLAGIPVVVCSASRDRIPQSMRYMRKPIDIGVLAEVVEEFCI